MTHMSKIVTEFKIVVKQYVRSLKIIDILVTTFKKNMLTCIFVLQTKIDRILKKPATGKVFCLRQL